MVGDYGFPCPNYIKIDVPGITEAVIAGGARTLRDPELRELHIELDERSEETSPIVETLARAKFGVVARHVRKGIADVTFARQG